MLILTFRLMCDGGHIPAIKEALSMLLERWGDVTLTEVREVIPEQMRIAWTNTEKG